MYMTDLEGKIRDDNFDEGIESLVPQADIRIICQNPVLRVNDGDNLNIGVYQDTSISNGDTINLNLNSEQDDYYAILNRAHLAYEIVFRPLSFFANQPSPDFPLGRKSSLRETRDQAKRIDLVYPDYSVAQLAWVEPKRLIDNFPLMHIKRRDIDPRLFGEGGHDPILIPHELAHALHFSSLSEAQRGRAQDKYAEFILTSPVSGVGPFHAFDERTTPEVAYIEAGGIFSENLMEFLRARQPGASTLVRPETITRSLQSEFLHSEWMRLTRNPFRILDSRPPLPLPLPRLPRNDFSPTQTSSPSRNRFLRRPTVTGGDVEGAVYSAIFVDFASAVGLDLAASSYFAANAITFGEYRTYINSQFPEHSQALEQARRFWGL